MYDTMVDVEEKAVLTKYTDTPHVAWRHASRLQDPEPSVGIDGRHVSRLTSPLNQL